MADYIPVFPTRGSLSGICPTCNAIITQWTSLARLNELKGKLDVKTLTRQPRIVDPLVPILNCHLEATR